MESRDPHFWTSQRILYKTDKRLYRQHSQTCYHGEFRPPILSQNFDWLLSIDYFFYIAKAVNQRVERAHIDFGC